MFRAQRISKIVQILDTLAVEFGKDIAGAQACFCRGRPGPDIGEADAIRKFREIRNAAEIGSVSGYFAGMGRGWIGRRLRLSHAHKFRPSRGISQMVHHIGHQAQQADGRGGVDFVPSVARLVIVGMQSREKEQIRDLLGGERGVVARSITGALGYITLQSEEISDYRLLALTEALTLLRKPIRRRVRAATRRSGRTGTRPAGRTVYLENGRRVPAVRA